MTFRLPHTPFRMFHPVLQRATVPVRAVAPRAISEERLLRVRRRMLGLALSGHHKLAPTTFLLPRILSHQRCGAVRSFDPVAHRARFIRLVVREPRSGSHRGDRNHLLDEPDAVAQFRTHTATYVHAEIHFLERLVQRNGNSEDARVSEMKSDEAHVSTASPFIELCPGGHVLRNQVRSDTVVQKGQVTPLGRKKNLGEDRHACRPDASLIPARAFRSNLRQMLWDSSSRRTFPVT